MRIPFSVFLMPVFWLALAAIPKSNWTFTSAVFVFFVLHFILYPASNGYNSLIDKDEGPVGGLEAPPKPNIQLQILVIIFDLVAISVSFFHNLIFGYCVSVYWIVSKAYSNPQIRIKKFAVLSWLVVAVFQGGWTVLMVWAGIMSELPDFELLGFEIWIWPLASTVLLAGSYPLTQIYQHAEDKSRGDHTISSRLGVKKTFVLAGVCLGLGSGILLTGLFLYHSFVSVALVMASSLPSLYFFSVWAIKSWKNEENADFFHTMRFNKISSIGLSLGFFAIVCLNIWANFIHLHPI